MYILNKNNKKILNMRNSDKVFDEVINYICTCVLKMQKCDVLIITIIAPLK
jgi:glutaredoxin-related protein